MAQAVGACLVRLEMSAMLRLSASGSRRRRLVSDSGKLEFCHHFFLGGSAGIRTGGLSLRWPITNARDGRNRDTEEVVSRNDF